MRRTFRSTWIPFSRSSRVETEEPSKFAGPDSGSGFILVPEHNVLESKMKCLDTNMGQRSDTGARRRGRRGRGLNIHISDVANIDVRRKNVEGRDVEILENEFNLVVLVLGSVLFAGEYTKSRQAGSTNLRKGISST
jgi:hypothetical protein